MAPGRLVPLSSGDAASQHRAFAWLSVAIALLRFAAGGAFRMAPWLVRLLGQTGINVITRIMGLLLMALGIYLLVTGIKGIFPGLLNCKIPPVDLQAAP